MNITTRNGLMAMIAATTIWGSFILLFYRLKEVPASDIIAHRALWGCIALLLWLAYKSRLHEVRNCLSCPLDVLRLTLSAALVGLNWLIFVWAVGGGYALEAGIGYFLFPIITVGIGALIKRARLNFLQWLSIALAGFAVVILSWGLGHIPWIAVSLAVTFSLYAPVKSKISSGALIGVAVEHIILLPLALIWLIFFADHARGFLDGSVTTAFWLIFAGIGTSVGLIAFSYASKVLSFFSVGILFFWNPILQALNAVVFIGSPLTYWHKLALLIVAFACLAYILDLWLRARRATA